jgi:hypothetical protein
MSVLSILCYIPGLYRKDLEVWLIEGVSAERLYILYVNINNIYININILF